MYGRQRPHTNYYRRTYYVHSIGYSAICPKLFLGELHPLCIYRRKFATFVPSHFARKFLSMCGRIVQYTYVDTIMGTFRVARYIDDEPFRPRYNIPPSANILTVA